MTRIYVTKEDKKPKIPNKRVPKKELTKKGKALRIGLFAIIISVGVGVGSSFLGSIFNPFAEDSNLGWADIQVNFITLSGEKGEYEGYMVDLYYAENGTRYEVGLTNEDFPRYVNVSTRFLIYDPLLGFEFQYRTIIGREDEIKPFVNTVWFKRAVVPGIIDVSTNVTYNTYIDPENPDYLNPITTEYVLSDGERIAEATTIECNDKTGLVGQEYFTFDLGDPELHYIWLDLSGSDLDPSVTTNGHRVDLSGVSDEAVAIASAITNVIDALDDVGADNEVGTSATITMTNEYQGEVTDATDGAGADGTGYIITVITQGAGQYWSDGLPFGDFYSYLRVGITNLPMGYTWGCSSKIPPDLFKAIEFIYPIAYLNSLDRKGLFLAFDTEFNISIYEYRSNGYVYNELNVLEVNLTSDPVPEKIWVVELHDIDFEKTLQFRFKTTDKNDLSNIYLWTGMVDEYESQFKYTQKIDVEDL